ncbi:MULTISPECIES: TRAP transporter substrate-binding protein [Prauserella salsuginis group]|uniref:Tripartite ATP-independent transporter DctP family solute receptor n=2 Tax=Prauserella salsuginis group TaxID=2893672 RepID=A0A839XLU6_9PSEU|nr:MULTISPECIES: TRAP transporter substrate-binding protein [Prauserella salsuginis group]MBB3661713.1 tripartite ATP-independent transporter DctP family solute receptor [Prauserella sediminis]MCR3719622.1 tripartite ATP-independent transporter solute receptor, DctP family [Prauserella flava]MCR3735364.1 tripartite ATP-independent transporter solute receptor, DctP family [Prauserella salsuginis]
MRNRLISGIVALILVAAVGACAPASGARTSAEATPENPLVLTLANNLGDDHVTSQALDSFAEDVERRSGGRIVVKIYGNGQLGDEPDVLGQLHEGIVDMTRVSAPGLATYDPGYHTFGLPYIFNSEREFYEVMDSPEMADHFRSTADKGFLGLTYYSSGARSFYTRGTPVRKPEDLRGLKTRVQDMRSQTDFVGALGAAPVVMAFGDTYTSLQTGLIDGAESNETVLTESAHGEVSKVFSMTEHTWIPDILVIGTETWDRLDAADEKLLTEAARASTERQKVAWAESIEQSIVDAKEMGVRFVDDVDTEAFRKATRPVVGRYAEEYPEVAQLLSVIESGRN